jgi:hypothetical protein
MRRNGKVRFTPSLTKSAADYCERCAAAGFLGHSGSEVVARLAEWKLTDLIAAGILPPPAIPETANRRRNGPKPSK